MHYMQICRCCCLVSELGVQLSYDPMGCSPTGSSVHGVLPSSRNTGVGCQASPSRGFSQPRAEPVYFGR